ncbi:MAG: TIGR00180 family glycosyltransferase [Planctomycetes bacterium]|nr:TIGR00180 family glycosyltransferase [Planctomycetota bacterium]
MTDTALPLTMIIPTIDRPELLARVLHYHRDFTGKIIIADGSREPSWRGNDARVRYLHLPSDLLDQANTNLRMRRAVEMADTPYIMMHADRRITTRTGIRTALAFLEENPEYSVADGRQVCIVERRGELTALPMYFNGHNGSVDADMPEQRLVDAYRRGYRPGMYGVARAEVWKCIYERQPLECVDQCFNEIFINHVMCIMGKKACLEVLYSVVLPVMRGPAYYRRGFFRSLLATDPVKRAEAALAELLGERTNRSFNDCLAAVRSGFNWFHHRYPLPLIADHLASCEPGVETVLEDIAIQFLDSEPVEQDAGQSDRRA